MKNTKKFISFYTWPMLWSIISIVLSLLSIYEEKLIQEWGWHENIFLFVPIAIIISIILIFMSLIQSIKKEMDKYEDLTKWIKDNPDYQNALTDHLDSIALYKKYDEEVLKILVSDLDDFFVLMPLHIAKKKSCSMNLTIDSSPSNSDKDALDKIADPRKEFMFAITDPNYLIQPDVEKKYKDLVIIAPLVRGVPLWLLINKSPQTNKLLTVSKDPNVFTGRIVDELFKHDYSIDTIDSIEQKMQEIYKKDRDCEKILKKNFRNLYKKETDINRIRFSHLLFLFSQDWDPSTKTKIRQLFVEYDAFFLTDPEMTYIQKTILAEENYIITNIYKGNFINKALTKDRKTGDLKKYKNIEDVQRDENKIIFTAIIANKTKMVKNPITALRFLRCLQIGLLKTNIALLTTENTEKFQDIFADSTTHSMLYKKAFEDIKNNEFLIKDNNYPNDLFIPIKRENSTPNGYTEYASFLLSEDEIKNNEALKLIIKGIPC